MRRKWDAKTEATIVPGGLKDKRVTAIYRSAKLSATSDAIN